MVKILFLSTGESFEVPYGTELFQAYLVNSSIPFRFGCTKGLCGVCEIKISQGKEHLSPAVSQENQTLKGKLQNGYRLACQCAIHGDIEID